MGNYSDIVITVTEIIVLIALVVLCVICIIKSGQALIAYDSTKSVLLQAAKEHAEHTYSCAFVIPTDAEQDSPVIAFGKPHEIIKLLNAVAE